jgi:hypothetical protein
VYSGGEVGDRFFVTVWIGDVYGFVAERGEEGVVLTGGVVAECGGDGIGECEGADLVEHGAGATLSSNKAS